MYLWGLVCEGGDYHTKVGAGVHMGEGWGMSVGASVYWLGWGSKGGGQQTWEKDEAYLWGPGM